MSDEFERVASLSELRDGQAQCVVLNDGDEVLLVRVDSTVYAVQPTCTHQETWLDMGTVLPRTLEIQCPLHDGRFDLRTGAPTNPPVRVPIKTYAVQIEDGSVFVAKHGEG
jgi:nitrite reductase/ring-hydroxylating ferredoxin subunit